MSGDGHLSDRLSGASLGTAVHQPRSRDGASTCNIDFTSMISFSIYSTLLSRAVLRSHCTMPKELKAPSSTRLRLPLSMSSVQKNGYFVLMSTVVTICVPAPQLACNSGPSSAPLWISTNQISRGTQSCESGVRHTFVWWKLSPKTVDEVGRISGNLNIDCGCKLLSHTVITGFGGRIL